MSPPTTALGCPGCGGPLFLLPGQRVVRCPWCASLDLVHLEPVVARFLAQPRLDPREVTAVVLDSLSHPALRRGVSRARILAPRLFFIPFYELQARRAGRARLDRASLRYPGGSDGDPLRPTALGAAEKQTSRLPRVVQDEVDTKVVLGSWSFYWPAVELPGWGLDGVEAQKLRARDAPPLERFDAVAADRIGTAFDPTVDPDAFRTAALRAAPTRSGDVKTIEERLNVLYHPVWRTAYVSAGRAFWATLDGLDGSVLRLCGPPSPEQAARRLMGVAAGAGIGAGFLARLAASLAAGPLPASHPRVTWLTALLLASAAVLSFAAANKAGALSDVVLVRRGTALEPE